jgi:hypothetical protein
MVLSNNDFMTSASTLILSPRSAILLEEDPLAYLDLLREFETVKRRIETDTTSKVSIRIPHTTINSLCESHQSVSLNSKIQSSPFASKIALRGDKMRVDADVMKSLFDKTYLDDHLDESIINGSSTTISTAGMTKFFEMST